MPWIVIGITVAIASVNFNNKNQDNKDKQDKEADDNMGDKRILEQVKRAEKNSRIKCDKYKCWIY